VIQSTLVVTVRDSVNVNIILAVMSILVIYDGSTDLRPVGMDFRGFCRYEISEVLETTVAKLC